MVAVTLTFAHLKTNSSGHTSQWRGGIIIKTGQENVKLVEMELSECTSFT